jgi:hypothetical protein
MTHWLELDAESFRESFDRVPFRIRHRLADHPLFQLPRLVELARTLPEKDVEYNAGNLALNQDPALTPQTGLSADETIRRIEECGSWMALKYVEQDPAYAKVLDECLDQIASHSEALSPGMSRREGFIFIGSPGAVTPYHMDPEINFLLHMRGPKTMSVFPRDDRSVLTEQEIEHFYTASKQRNMVYRDEYAAKARVFELTPGEVLHLVQHHVPHLRHRPALRHPRGQRLAASTRHRAATVRRVALARIAQIPGAAQRAALEEARWPRLKPPPVPPPKRLPRRARARRRRR